jgi:ribosomal protein S16
LYNENANARPYKEISLDSSRAKYWLGVGAQPSDPVWKLMNMVSFDPCFCLRESLRDSLELHDGHIILIIVWSALSTLYLMRYDSMGLPLPPLLGCFD